MRFYVRDLLGVFGAHRDFRETLNLKDVKSFGEHPFQEPVAVTGSVRNMAGALELSGEASGVLSTRCSRCLKPLRLPFTVPVKRLLAETLANAQDADNDEIVLLTDGAVDLDELFATECILALDGKYLCAPDCKGLCPRCGKNLNEGSCGCGKELDPRFAVLAELLDTDREKPSD